MVRLRRGIVGVAAALGLAACATTSASSPPPGSDPPPPTDEPSSVFTEDEIDRAIERNVWLLDNGDENDQLRAHLALGDAYWSRASLAEAQLHELDDAPAQDDRVERARIRHRQRDSLERAAREYEAVLAATGPLARKLRPQARFGLAEVARTWGDPTTATQQLEVLVQQDSDHPLAAAAWILLADDAFDHQRLVEAEAAYREVLGSAQLFERLYARYKLGWIALNREDGEQALDHWTQVVLEGKLTPKGQLLAREAAKDCVMAFVMVGQPEQAGAFFAQLYPERSSELLADLAERYRAEGRPEDAAKVLGQRGSTPPMHRAPP